MIRLRTLVTVVLAGLLSAAAAKSQQAPKQSGPDSDREAMQEAIRFEKAKLAAAKAQAAKDAGAKPAKKAAAVEEKKPTAQAQSEQPQRRVYSRR